MRRCKTAPGSCKLKDKPCCADCTVRPCENRCENDPDRCGCWTEEEPRPKSRPIKYDYGEIMRLRKEGLSIRQIAARVGCATSTVSDALRRVREKGGGHE